MMPANSHSPAALSKGTNYKTRHMFPFLKLSGELRNHIYECVAADAPEIRVFEGRTILPPLARTCRKIRSEMEGKYQEEVLLNPRIPLHVYSADISFSSMFEWLDENDRRLEGHANFVRTLHIRLDMVSPILESTRHGQRGTSAFCIKSRAREARRAFERRCCVSKCAPMTQNGELELRSLESTVPTISPLTGLSSYTGPLRKRLKTSSGNCYLASCSVRTLHDHQASESSEHLDSSSSGYYCHLCAYIGWLSHELGPLYGHLRDSWSPSARRLHLLVKSAIVSSCESWRDEERRHLLRGSLTLFDTSVINLRWDNSSSSRTSYKKADATDDRKTDEQNLSLDGSQNSKFAFQFRFESKQVASEGLQNDQYMSLADPVKRRQNQKSPNDKLTAGLPLRTRVQTGQNEHKIAPVVSKTDKATDDIEDVIRMIGRMQLSDK